MSCPCSKPKRSPQIFHFGFNIILCAATSRADNERASFSLFELSFAAPFGALMLSNFASLTSLFFKTCSFYGVFVSKISLPKLQQLRHNIVTLLS